jgi:hypothetical protein
MSNPQLGGLTQFSFGTYNFPATFQESKRSTTLALDKQKVPFNYGAHAPSNTNSDARVIELKGPVGSLVVGSGLNTLVTADDLEKERRLLAGLQIQGRQELVISDLQYCFAYLETFSHVMWQDAFGHRYADWVLTFWVDDPRYFAITPTTTTQSKTATSGLTTNTISISTQGNCRAYPQFTFTSTGGAGNANPYVAITNTGGGGQVIGIGFSLLSMAAGSVLAIDCDPRPNHRAVVATYTPSGAASINGLQFCAISDFANTYDLSEWMPFIDPAGLSLVLSYGFINGGGQTYNFNVNWSDRWM